MSSTDGRGNATTFLYNAQGQRICTIDAATNATWYAFDAFGRLVAQTNALGEVTVYEYNLQGRKTYEGGGTYPVRFTYDDEGRMMSMITYRDESGPGDTTAWVYDPATGLLVQKRYDDGKGPSYTYTPDGKLASRTWARGVTTTYTYDGWGNLTNTVHSDGTPSVSMAYDVMGRQIETSDAGGVTTFAYDSFSSLTNETVAGQYTKSLDRQIDDYGRNVGFSLDGQRKQTVAYDPATGRIATMDGFAWQYLLGTDLKRSLAYPNGTEAEWAYEPRRDLLTLVSNDVFSAYAYENDAAGRRIAKNTERYGYNVRGELIAATNTATAAHYAYTFDAIGNRIVADELGTNIAYAANALNQYTNIVAEAVFIPEFDDDGNQTLVKTSTGIWHVAYNAENRPVVWSNETAVVTMDFDRMGRRVWYASVSGGETNVFSKFVYNGYLCVQQLDGLSGDVEQDFVWDPTETVATRPLKWTLPGLGRTFFYFHDGNKNVSDVIDASDGSLAAHYDYAPFGAVTAATGPLAAVNPYRFSSEYHDDALGCVYYNYRHYNPLDGRWMARDPIGERHNTGLADPLYVFLANEPLFHIDFRGLWTCDFCCPDQCLNNQVRLRSAEVRVVPLGRNPANQPSGDPYAGYNLNNTIVTAVGDGVSVGATAGPVAGVSAGAISLVVGLLTPSPGEIAQAIAGLIQESSFGSAGAHVYTRVVFNPCWRNQSCLFGLCKRNEWGTDQGGEWRQCGIQADIHHTYPLPAGNYVYTTYQAAVSAAPKCLAAHVAQVTGRR